MTSAELHPKESERLHSLESLHILDTNPEEAYDELTALAASVTGKEIALVSLIDKDRQWFKSHHGINATETPRDQAFCAHAILNSNQPFVIENALDDVRFVDNPLVTDNPGIRFYAGIPLQVPEDDLPIGTLCAISSSPGKLTPEQLSNLERLARQVERLFSLRKSNYALKESKDAVEEANERLREADKAKDHFLATISHDIRTPLNGIIGTIDLIRSDHSDQQPLNVSHIDTIEACGKGLMRLTNNVLDMSKIAANIIDILPTQFNLRELMKEVTAIGHSMVQNRKIDFIEEIQIRDNMTVYGDSNRIHQVLINLISNAFKFTVEGHITLEAKYTAPGKLSVRVADTGMGIPENQKCRIFKPYQRVNTPEHTAILGTGLGLHICRNICEAMGGDIQLIKSDKNGSCFKMVIPLSEVTFNTTEDTASDNHQSWHILIADDNAVNRAVLKATLERLGCTTTLAVDGSEALKILRSDKTLDAAFIDYHMPQLSGLEVCQQWHQERTVKLIALTASNLGTVLKKLKDAGFDRVCTKPIRMDKMKRLIAELQAEVKPKGARKTKPKIPRDSQTL